MDDNECNADRTLGPGTRRLINARYPTHLEARQITADECMSYWRGWYRPSRHGQGLSLRSKLLRPTILLGNVLVFGLWQKINPDSRAGVVKGVLLEHFVLSSNNWKSRRCLTLFSHIFLHQELNELLGGMFGFWTATGTLVRRLGERASKHIVALAISSACVTGWAGLYGGEGFATTFATARHAQSPNWWSLPTCVQHSPRIVTGFAGVSTVMTVVATCLAPTMITRFYGINVPQWIWSLVYVYSQAVIIGGSGLVSDTSPNVQIAAMAWGVLYYAIFFRNHGEGSLWPAIEGLGLGCSSLSTTPTSHSPPQLFIPPPVRRDNGFSHNVCGIHDYTDLSETTRRDLAEARRWEDDIR